MARATSGLGQFRGKVGSVVFRVNQGQQIASAYQPAVRNPKSNLQTAQRNKMYLASQLSKLVPREDIIGLAPRGTARDRRNVFLRNILDNAISSQNGEVFSTIVSPEYVTFSNGNAMEGVSVNYTSGNEFTIVINKSIISEEQYNRLAIKMMQTDVSNGVYVGYKSAWLELPSYTGVEGNLEIDVTFTSYDSVNGTTTIWLTPVVLNDGYRYSSERKTIVQYANVGDLSGFAIQGEYAISNAVLEWKKSIYALDTTNTGEIVPPSTGGDSVVNPDGPNFPNLG